MRKRWVVLCVLGCLCLGAGLAAGEEEPLLEIDPQGHSARINEVLFTPDGKALISISDDKTIRLWDTATGDLSRTIRGQIGAGPEGMLNAAALSPDGKILVVGGFLNKDGGADVGDIRLLNLASGEQIGLLKGHTSVIHVLAFSPDGQYLASGNSDATVRLWKIPPDLSGLPNLTGLKLTGHTKNVYGVAFAPDGRKLVSASYDGTLRLWELPKDLSGLPNLTGLKYTEMKKHTAEVQCVAYAPNGKYIVSGGLDDKILLWDRNGKFIKEIDKRSANINTLSFSSDSKKIIAGIGETQEIMIVYAIPSGKKLITFTKHTNTVVASAFYGNDVIATAGGDDKDIYLWDAASGKVKTHIVGKGRSVWATAFGKGFNVAFGNTSNYISDSSRWSLEKSFDFAEMKLQQPPPVETEFRRTQTEYQGNALEKISDDELRITKGGVIKNDPRYDQKIRAYTFTKDGEIVVGSSFSLKLYKNDGAFLREFVGHTGEVWAVSVSEDGRILASASYDQTIKLWNIQTGECLATLFVAADNEWVCWTPQGYYAASAGGEKYIGWHINQGLDKAALFYPVSAFRPQFFKPELVQRTIAEGSFAKALAALNAESPYKILERGPLPPPIIEWLAPQETTVETGRPTFHIHAKIVSKSEIKTVKILINGRPPAAGRDFKPSPQDSRVYKEIDYDLALTPGRNEIAIFAENVNANATSDKRVVLYEVKELKPNLYMVAIGISDYPNKDLRLNFADADAKAMCAAFRQQQGKMYEKVNVRELYDRAATRVDILDALDWLKAETTPNDVVILFIAAHGQNSDGKYYILPADVNPAKLKHTSVDWTDFEILGEIPARVLLFLDTCHSGQLGQNLAQINNTEAVRKLASDDYGVVIFSASRGNETSVEKTELQHGAFTKALLQGIAEGQADYNKDGKIELPELEMYVIEQVTQFTANQQHPNTQKPSTISRFPIAQVK